MFGLRATTKTRRGRRLTRLRRRRGLGVTMLAGAAVWLGAAAPIAAGGTASGAPSARQESRVPNLSHVFTIVLENTGNDAVVSPAGQAAMPYLTSLRSRGVTLDQMYGVGHVSLTNYIAMTSGNAPTPLTRADCLQYNCIYTSSDGTHIGDQLESTGHTWKAYLESMPAPCTHPTPSGSFDPYQVGYATRHNPFMYYQNVVGTDLTAKPVRCVEHDVPFTQLATDLAAHALPNYALIVPDTCNDAHDGGAKCGLSAADKWLRTNLPPILQSDAYRDDGAVVITFDESDFGDSTGCCGAVPGGGHIFTLVLSPHVTPGADSAVPYNHYSLLRTVEEAFGLPCLRHACDPGVAPFGRDVWGTGRVVTTRYSSDDAQLLSTVASHFGTFPLAQKRAVYALAWVTAAGGHLERERVVPPPRLTGPVAETSGWGPDERSILQFVMRHYHLTAPQAQKFAVEFWAQVLSAPH